MARMSLDRVWRRRLYGASSAALIVPAAMFAALVVLALGGGFSQVGVLGQIFAGPPAPSVGGGARSGEPGTVAARLAATALPVIPGAVGVQGRTRRSGAGSGAVRGGGAPAPSGGSTRTGGSLGGAPIVTQGSGGPAAAPAGPAAPSPAGSTSSETQPKPQPKPRPTPVDQIVSAVTPVTQQVPAPVGPAATQAVQAAGSAADSLLPPSGSTLPQGPAAP